MNWHALRVGLIVSALLAAGCATGSRAPAAETGRAEEPATSSESMPVGIVAGAVIGAAGPSAQTAATGN